MNRFRGTLAVLVLAASVCLAPVAAASEAEGCYGSVTSQELYGQQVSADRPPDGGATRSDPFVVDPEGTVTWVGEASAVITDAKVTVTAMGIPVLTGDAPNVEGLRLHEGSYRVSDLPAPVGWLLHTSAVIPVTVTISGAGGSCVVSGYVTGTGASATSPTVVAGVIALLIGILVLTLVALRTRRLPAADYLPEGYDADDFGAEVSRHPVVAFLGGLVLGIGVALLLVSFGILPAEPAWLIACVVGCAILAVVGAFVVPPRKAPAE